MKFTVPDRIISVHVFDSEALRQNPKIAANVISFIPSKIKWDLIPNPKLDPYNGRFYDDEEGEAELVQSIQDAISSEEE